MLVISLLLLYFALSSFQVLDITFEKHLEVPQGYILELMWSLKKHKLIYTRVLLGSL